MEKIIFSKKWDKGANLSLDRLISHGILKEPREHFIQHGLKLKKDTFYKDWEKK